MESWFYLWKRFKWSKSLLLRFPPSDEKIPPAKFLISPHWGDSPPPLTVIWKTLVSVLGILKHNNLKSFFKKVGSLHTYSWQLYQKVNSFTGIFQRYHLYFKNDILSPPMHSPPMHWLKSPSHHQIFKSPPCSQHLWETL